MKEEPKRAVAALACVLCLWATPARSAEITVAAAADLNFAFKEIAADFEKRSEERRVGKECRL